jgi:hypothetical protein
LVGFWIRLVGYSALRWFKPGLATEERLKMYRVIVKWHWHINPVRFIERGDEPYTGYSPLAPAPNMVESTQLSERTN